MRRIKKSTKQYILVSIIISVIVVTGFVITHIAAIKQIENDYETKINGLNTQIDNNTKGAFVSTEEIKRGDVISEKNVQYKTIYSDMKDGYISNEDLGKIAVVGIEPNSYILNNMITEKDIDSSLRENEFSCIRLSSNLIKNDYVDVRIMFPNGETYVVLSKKSLKDMNHEISNCFVWLDASEIDNMSSAIVDAYLHQGLLYTVKYIEPNIQDESIVNYVPNEAVMDLIASDPNVIEEAKRELSKKVRKQLEKRLEQYKEQHKGTWKQQESTSLNYNKSIYDNNIDTYNEDGSNSQLNDSEETTDDYLKIGSEEDKYVD